MNTDWITRKSNASREVLKVYDLKPILIPGNGDSVRFRVEILRDCGGKRLCRARVWRSESYRLRPTFPQEKGRPKGSLADEMIWVEDAMLSGKVDKIIGKSPKRVFSEVLRCVCKTFY